MRKQLLKGVAQAAVDTLVPRVSLHYRLPELLAQLPSHVPARVGGRDKQSLVWTTHAPRFTVCDDATL